MTTGKTVFQNIVEGIGLFITTPLACAPLASDNPLRLPPDEDVLPLPEQQPPAPVADAAVSVDTAAAEAGDAVTSEIPKPMKSYDTFNPSPLECQPGRLWSFADGGSTPLCLRFTEKAADLGLQSTASAHNGVVVFDVDSDGDQDLYILNGGNQANELFINNGEAGFVESAANFGLNIAGDSRDAIFGDYDQDGDNDMFLVGAFGSRIYENNGGVFKIVDGEKGIYNDEPGRTAKLIDGGILLATKNGVRFYKTISQGYFEEATAEAGFKDESDVSAIAVEDYDGDGLKDVYLASAPAQNRLFRNLGQGKYESVDDTIVTDAIGQSVDAEWVMLQPDDELYSLFVANFGLANQLYLNLGEGQFVNIAQDLKLQDPGNTTVARWGDFLGNGFPAVFLGRWEQENLLYLPIISEDGQQVESYDDIQEPMGMNIAGKTRDADWLDYDNDGLLDLVVVMADGAVYLYHNENHWISKSE